MMYQGRCKIISNIEIASANFKMSIRASQIARNAKPGQFIEVSVNGVGGASGLILRRPLSIHRVKKEVIEVIYQVIGKGTQALSAKKSGSLIDIIGPLGNGFDLPKGKEQKIVLVAGGMGVAPLVFLAEELNQLQVRCLEPASGVRLAGEAGSQLVHGQAQLIAFIGAKTKKLLLCEDEFRKAGCDIKIATDDGSRGHKGFVTDLFKSHMNQLQVVTSQVKLVHGQAQLPTIYACGPHPMLKQVARIAKQHNVPAQVSLEERMACGFGACLGCAVKCEPASGSNLAGEAGSYKLVCKDGPVFNANEVAW